MKYCIDTSSLLNAHCKHYPPDVFGSLWAKIEKLIADGVLIAPDEVLHEIEKQDDVFHNWAKSQPDLFIPIDGRVQEVVRDILKNYPRLIDTRKNRSGADPWVIALAVVEECPVVTEESHSGNPEKPRIPDVCKAYNIQCLNIIMMFRELKLQI